MLGRTSTVLPHPLGLGDEVLEVEGAPSRYYDDFARILTSLFKATSSMQFVDRKFLTVNDKLIFRFGQIPPVSLQVCWTTFRRWQRSRTIGIIGAAPV